MHHNNIDQHMIKFTTRAAGYIRRAIAQSATRFEPRNVMLIVCCIIDRDMDWLTPELTVRATGDVFAS